MSGLEPIQDPREILLRGRAPLSIHPLGPRPADSTRQHPEEPLSAASGGDHIAVPASDASTSLTYERYYGLREKPFSLSADPRFLYRSPSHAPAFDDLHAAIRRREGLIVLTGDIGAGKTTLCRAVLKQLDRKTFSTFVPDPFLSRNDLLKMILIDFGVMSVEDLKSGRMQGASRPDLSYPLYAFLDSLVPLQAFAVLVIDEAQNLSLPLLEEIRILSDLERREKLLQVVLVGQPEFRAKIKLPQMRQLDQRISVRCELPPLTRLGVTGYVSHRLAVAGGSPDRVDVTPEALDLVHAVSHGIPRVINLVCDRGLHHGWIDRASRIDAGHIRQALADLDLATGSVPVVPPAPVPARAPVPREDPEAGRSPERGTGGGLFSSLAPPTGEPEAPFALDVDLSSLMEIQPDAPSGPETTAVREPSAAPIADPATIEPVGQVTPTVQAPLQPRDLSSLYARHSLPPETGVFQRVLVALVLLVLLALGGAMAVGYLLDMGPFASLGASPETLVSRLGTDG